MAYKHDKINKLEGGWYIVYKNGNVITERDMPWVQIPNKKDIDIMGLKWRNRYIELKGKDSYVPPGETQMRELSVSDGSKVQVTKQSLVGRFIGYYDKDYKVISRIDHSTGKLTTEKIPYN